MTLSETLGIGTIDIESIKNWLIFIFAIFVALMFMTSIVIFLVFRKRRIAINLYHERAGDGNYVPIKITGKKKYRKGSVFIKISKMGIVDKLIPDVESDYILQNNRGKSNLNLVLDKRGFIHKIKFPKMDKVFDFLVWEQLMQELKAGTIGNPQPIGQDITQKILERHSAIKSDFILNNPEYDIVGIPNIHETVDFITNQIKEAKGRFGSFVDKYSSLVIIGSSIIFALIVIVMAMIMAKDILQ